LHKASTGSPLQDGIGVISGKIQKCALFRTAGPQAAQKIPHAFFKIFFAKKSVITFYVL
jgi:hypothetical protein